MSDAATDRSRNDAIDGTAFPARLRVAVEPFGGPGWRAIVGLRDQVLRRPLGLRLDDASVAAERADRHLALWLGTELVGCALLAGAGEGEVATLRQMAIAPGHRGRGFGASVLSRAEAEARDAGACAVRLAARDSAVGFYRRAGYLVTGPPFVSVTLPHRPMEKSLAAT